MQDLEKVSSLQLYSFWKNLSVGLLSIVGVIALSIILPFFFSPIIAILAAALLYTILYNNKLKKESQCMVVIYSVFYCLISYSFISIVLNVLDIWGIISLPKELSFFAYPYIPSLLLNPICFVTMLIIYFRRKKLNICVDCKLKFGGPHERGKLGSILAYESHLQLRNVTVIFGVLSVIVWLYYGTFYVEMAEVNKRDWYVFMWLTIILFLLDEVYFIIRYYNLYLDMRDNDEIITPEELRDMTAKTYIRYYVICGEYVYLHLKNVSGPRGFEKTVIDTPFFTKRSVNGITFPEVSTIIKEMTGVNEGDLRFFFGRKIADMERHSLLRYFYYLEGTPEDYPELKMEGEWLSFENLKGIYSYRPSKLDRIFISDMTRLATIMLTYKLFDENGFRRNKIKSYHPTFTIKEIRESGLDFQDDKWIRISLFNSDIPLYRFKKWLKKITSPNKNVNQWD